MNDYRQERDIEIDMLQGNINRMCVTDDLNELNEMYNFAHRRLFKIFYMNFMKLMEMKADDIQNN